MVLPTIIIGLSLALLASYSIDRDMNSGDKIPAIFFFFLQLALEEAFNQTLKLGTVFLVAAFRYKLKKDSLSWRQI